MCSTVSGQKTYIDVVPLTETFSALIEVMPVGYVDYLFNVMAESCKVWYYELQSRMDPGM